MSLFIEQQLKQLLSNGSAENRDKDHPPVVRLFIANTSMVWLVNELHPEMPLTGFGLCDLGTGFPELGYLKLEEIAGICSHHMLTLERDQHFNGKYPMSVYAKAARLQQPITTDDIHLEQTEQIIKTQRLKP